MSNRLADKRVLVIGGSSGIGTVVLFLAAPFATGSKLLIDGGDALI